MRFVAVITALALLSSARCSKPTSSSLETFVLEEIVAPNHIVDADGTFEISGASGAHRYEVVTRSGYAPRSMGDGDRFVLEFVESDVIPIEPSWAIPGSRVPLRDAITSGRVDAASRVRFRLDPEEGNRNAYRFAGEWMCVHGTVSGTIFVGSGGEGWKCQPGSRNEFAAVYEWALQMRNGDLVASE